MEEEGERGERERERGRERGIERYREGRRGTEGDGEGEGEIERENINYMLPKRTRIHTHTLIHFTIYMPTFTVIDINPSDLYIHRMFHDV